MTIPLLPLDDRRFDDLVQEFQALAPRYAEEWTNRNAADPGIMLLELFAWLTESQLYRINRVPKAVTQSFLQWLLAAEAQANTPVDAARLEAARRQVYEAYSHPQRLITKEDYETILGEKFRATVARVACFPERDFTADAPTHPRRGHISVMLIVKPVTTPFARLQLASDQQVTQFVVSPDEQVVALLCTPKNGPAATTEKTLVVWNAQPSKPMWSKVLSASVSAVTFRSDSKRLLVKLADERCQWLVADGAAVPLYSQARLDGATWQATKSVGERTFTLEEGARKIRVWDNKWCDEIAIFTIPTAEPAGARFQDGLFSSDGRYLLTTIGSPTAQQQAIWQMPTDAVDTFVANNRQVGCRHHVVGARYKPLALMAEIVLAAGAPEKKRQEEIRTRLQTFFDPRTGGPDGAGWPFGRQVTQSEVHHIIHSVPDVEYVTRLTLNEEAQDVIVGTDELVNLYQLEITIKQPQKDAAAARAVDKKGRRA